MNDDKINKPEEIQEEILDKATGGSSIPIMMYTCKVCGKEISFDEKKRTTVSATNANPRAEARPEAGKDIKAK